jgi:hypothetical protein
MMLIGFVGYSWRRQGQASAAMRPQPSDGAFQPSLVNLVFMCAILPGMALDGECIPRPSDFTTRFRRDPARKEAEIPTAETARPAASQKGLCAYIQDRL